MTIVYLLIVGFGVMTCALVGKMVRSLEARHNSLDERVDEITRVLHAVQEKLLEIEYNTLSPVEKDSLVFENAKGFFLSDVQALKEGDVLHHISQSWVFPEEEPRIDRFEYKHNRLDEGEKTHHGYRVHGYQRWSDSEEWSP